MNIEPFRAVRSNCSRLARVLIIALWAFSSVVASGQPAWSGPTRMPGSNLGKAYRVSAPAPYYSGYPYGYNTSKFMLFPYVWLVSLDGTVAVDNVNAPVSISLGDALSNLDPALSLHFEGSAGRYSIWFDGMYLNLSSDPFRTANNVQMELSFEYVISEFIVSYHPGESRRLFEPFIGGRYTNLYARVISDNPLANASRRRDWFDPLLGGRFVTELSERMILIARADIGGFGVGSDLTWGLTAGLGFRLSKSIVLTGAYRLLDVDYENSEGVSSFKYDAQQSGGLAGVAFLF